MTSDAATSRRYLGRQDLADLLDFASAVTAQRSPRLATWHPGDIAWALKASIDEPQANRFWLGPDGAAVMLAWFDGPGEVLLEVLPSAEHLVPEAVRWAEARWRERAPAGAPASLSVRAYEDDSARIAGLEALGYRRAGPAGVSFRLSLSSPLPSAARLPDGIALRDCVGVDVERRAAAHRGAWNHLEHLGIDARSTFDAAAYRTLSGLPPYDAALDILAETAEGDYVANCIAWADAASGIAVFEPVGTGLAFRGQRLASAVIGEALRRLQARGLAEARVGTAHFNGSAIAAYLACGFKPAGGSHWWSRTLT